MWLLSKIADCTACFCQRLPALREDDVRNYMSVSKKRSYLTVVEAGDAAAYAGDEEGEFGMLLRKADKVIHVRLYRLDASLHGGDGIALALQPYALPVDGAEALVGYACGSSSVVSGEVASKDKNLILLEVCDIFGRVHAFLS